MPDGLSADHRNGGASVGLAPLSGGEHQRPGGQLRWDIDDLLAVGQQPVGDVSADALAALDQPDSCQPVLT
jgi:hypothetical protein